MAFEEYIKEYLKNKYQDDAELVLQNALILQYIIFKTRSANKGSKSRGSFANLYAVYVIVEDYLKQKFDINNDYSKYEGAQFSTLLKRQRELPFGEKLQNHALNSRMNDEFVKYFPAQKEMYPILRNTQTQRYWFNENYLNIKVGKRKINIAEDIIAIIDAYAKQKQSALKQFIAQCEELQKLEDKENDNIKDFIDGLLALNTDARFFEIVSYAILKYYYKDTVIYWGYSVEDLNEDSLKLYKTGRTNANDGGIDFVMKPLGKFFQVTETLDFKKYFLDIEKVERYPISFVIKSEDTQEDIRQKLKSDAIKTYGIEDIVEMYMNCIEEIITIPILKEFCKSLEYRGLLQEILNEIIIQSKVEFNYEDDDE